MFHAVQNNIQTETLPQILEKGWNQYTLSVGSMSISIWK